VFYTYILASRPNGTLYTGHTDSLTVRVGQHRDEMRRGFTARYGVKMLVWYESHGSREAAKRREAQIKKWNRAWKIRLIRERNPDWQDLFEGLFRAPPEALGPERL
jgi:putative endonuclease